MTGLPCSDCIKLKIQIAEKDADIKKLTFQIQNLTKSLQCYEGRSCHQCCCSKEVRTELHENYATYDSKVPLETDPVMLLSSKIEDKLEETGSSNYLEASDAKDDNENIPDSDAFQASEEYLFDENYQMYYCVSSGYYYDRNSGLYYVPQNGAFYTYDYAKSAYVLYEWDKTAIDVKEGEVQNSKSEADVMNKELENRSSKADDSCESVVDQVNSLNINDVGRSINSTVSPITADHVISESRGNETDVNLSNAWETPAGSQQTIQDLVREVAEQNSGISDYVFDEKYQMYYSTSTGYYYDSVKKLLYNPQTGTYYQYDEETSTYNFYYQADLSATEVETKAKQTTTKVKARRKYWRKKLIVAEEKSSGSQKCSMETDGHEENYSSPEEGELFSSESDQETESQSEAQPQYSAEAHPQNSSDNYSPCIRAIVKESTKFKIGTLILITCSGAIIGREKTNAVHIPEIGVSKTHAEVSFNSKLWKYVIKDLGSQNGTFVNDSRLSEPKELSLPCVLNHGDIVSVGSCKLMFHIHVGHETCNECEPGQVMAENPTKEENLISVFKTKEEKEKERRQEVRRLKKKYGLEGMGYEEVKNSILPSSYEDKAEVRRQTVGSENPFEKTEASSLESTVNESNKGYQMLKKLGWKEGDSLGATGQGISEPIPLRPWLSKAGLGSSEEEKVSMLTVAQDKRNKKWVLAQERFLKLT